jgi:hypothetical protein
LIPANPPVAVASANYYFVPPARVGNPPEIAVEVDAPEPAERPDLYGDAQWVRVYVTELPQVVPLADLVTTNALVPQDPTQLESDYSIMQDEPASGGNGKRKRHRHQGTLKPTTRMVVRRIEMYQFTGPYDPITHEALRADGLCNVPGPGELGDLISAQMTGVEVQSDSVTVTKTGNGNVDSGDKFITCGSKCVAPYNAGTLVALTAKAASGSVFAGWGGGGGGTTANPVLSAKISGGKDSVVSGSGAINCGKICAASLPSGTVVNLTTAAEPGFFFVNWSGACAGTAPTCQVSVISSATAQANFAN